MNIADTAKRAIRGIFLLSPYAWADTWLKRRELAAADPAESRAWRQRRLLLSERYIGYWLFAAAGLMFVAPFLPQWLAWGLFPLVVLRAIGIINKELGVILFGICKITEGTAVSASGRVIVLALTNYVTALFLFATLYLLGGRFADLPAWVEGDRILAAFLHAATVHFSLGGLFAPANAATALITTGQVAFCFLFGTIVISLFVSLLNIRPLEK